MIKKIFIFIMCLAALLPSMAQQSSGLWKIYPVVGTSYENIIDTKNDKVYFLSAGSLYSYDKKTQETYFYDSSNKLSGSNISAVYYNHDSGYLLIIYADTNMDMLYDDGKCYNLPEIKDANMTDEKIIKDVAFGNGYIGIATNFGIVLYNENKREVVDSGIYRKTVDAIAICGDNLIIYTPYRLLHAKLNERHNSIDKFTELGGAYTDRVLDVSDNVIAWVDLNTNNLVVSEIDFQNLTKTDRMTSLMVDSDLSKCEAGFYFKSGNDIIICDGIGEKIDSFTIPDDLQGNCISIWSGKESVWLGGEQGSANYNLASGQPVVVSDWYRPESITCKAISYFYISQDGNRIYLSNLGPSESRRYMIGDAVAERQYTNLIEDGKITDVSIINASARVTASYQKKNKNQAMYGGTTRLALDPLNSDIYYIGNGQEGLYVVKGNEEIWHFDQSNAPFFTYWNTRVFDVNFDPQGNLWVGHDHIDPDHSPYLMLPAAKLRGGFENIKNEDWLWPDLLDMTTRTKDFISLFCKKSNFAFFICGKSYKGVYALNTRGTYDNLSDDICYNFSTIEDQDGTSYQPQYIYCLAEDELGRVWVGTNQGLYYFSNPAAINENTTVIRPKVPRNDGTNYADFLLDSEQINSIAVDPSNRKWIATDLSGVYLVSENGDKILKHFDTSNSPLPSNRVTAVICDPHSNTVYFGTQYGLFSYSSDSAPGMDDYSAVYAYPNPVKPDYTGWITVTGLMDNSLVKIADINGNVFFQGRSEGGMITWDGCNQAGERVRSGIYYVYASTGGDGQTSNGAVTKIMVVN